MIHTSETAEFRDGRLTMIEQETQDHDAVEQTFVRTTKRLVGDNWTTTVERGINSDW